MLYGNVPYRETRFKIQIETTAQFFIRSFKKVVYNVVDC